MADRLKTYGLHHQCPTHQEDNGDLVMLGPDGEVLLSIRPDDSRASILSHLLKTINRIYDEGYRSGRADLRLELKRLLELDGEEANRIFLVPEKT